MIHGVLQSLALQKFCYRLISCWHLPRISMDNNNNNSFIYRLFFKVSVRFSNKSLMLLHPRIFIGHSLHSRSFLKSTRERNCYWVWKIRSRGRGWGERFIFSPPSHLSRSPLPTSTPLLIFAHPRRAPPSLACLICPPGKGKEMAATQANWRNGAHKEALQNVECMARNCNAWFGVS